LETLDHRVLVSVEIILYFLTVMFCCA